MNHPFERHSAVHVTEHLWIPLPDGIRLSARLWLPTKAAQDPVGAVLEYIPYRKRDMVRARDERNHPYWAVHGYACLRVDMRGSGDSEGVMRDMYAEEELSDARAVIEWIAAQPWCNGRVAMLGTSWGGTAALQASVDPPTALKTVIAVCATHDRYEDDIHHKGGCLLTDSLEWGTTLPAILASPPSEIVGPDWMSKWRDRIEAVPFPLEAWLREEARGEYWRRGSVRFQTDRIGCPVLAVGGWSDRYSSSIMSLVAARPDIVWGVVGPWGHHYPDEGHPGPAMGFQQTVLAWLDHWLSLFEPDVPNWPRLRVWLREFDPPGNVLDRRNGHWVESGPAPVHVETRLLHLTDAGLSDNPKPARSRELPTDLRHGTAAGDTGYFGRFGGLPLKQSEDDDRALVFETPALQDDLVIYGSVVARFLLHAEEARSQIVLRLCDVSADGVSSRIGLSARNLALDDSLDAPQDAQTGFTRDVRIGFHNTAYRVRAGHRLRLAVATSYWPMIWPQPRISKVYLEGGALELPILSSLPSPVAEPFEGPLDLPPIKSHSVVAAPELLRQIETGPNLASVIWHQPEVAVHYHEIDTTFAFETRSEHSIDPRDPNSAESMFRHVMRFDRPDGSAVVDMRVTTTSTENHFLPVGELSVYWNGETMFERRWSSVVERRYS